MLRYAGEAHFLWSGEGAWGAPGVRGSPRETLWGTSESLRLWEGRRAMVARYHEFPTGLCFIMYLAQREHDYVGTPGEEPHSRRPDQWVC